jgi:hypothetical protein
LCSDVDGCEGVNCGGGAVCQDVAGPQTGYTCSCAQGYGGLVMTRKPASCTDIDGCADVNCGVYALCTDVLAPRTGYTCKCGDGYSGDSTNGEPTTCVDSDGCVGVVCGAGATCIDVLAPGRGYACDCGESGYEAWTTTDAACVDLDGCAEVECGAGATCIDVPAPGTGYACDCGESGYEARTTTDAACVDLNGCAGGVGCGPGAICSDVPAPGEGYVCTCETSTCCGFPPNSLTGFDATSLPHEPSDALVYVYRCMEGYVQGGNLPHSVSCGTDGQFLVSLGTVNCSGCGITRLDIAHAIPAGVIPAYHHHVGNIPADTPDESPSYDTCMAAAARLCGSTQHQGTTECSACMQSNSTPLMAAGCHADDFTDFCVHLCPHLRQWSPLLVDWACGGDGDGHLLNVSHY